MSTILGLDVGSSSVIAGILRGTYVLKESPRTFFKSQCTGQRVEVAPESLLEAVAKAVSSLGGASNSIGSVCAARLIAASGALRS